MDALSTALTVEKAELALGEFRFFILGDVAIAPSAHEAGVAYVSLARFTGTWLRGAQNTAYRFVLAR